jgi:NAD-dependent dihydropyrimidine dehydrogenase PreA subunit
MRSDAIFIAVEVDDAIAVDPEAASRLAEVCPVDIYARRDRRLDIVEDNLDECVLCGLCLEAAPEGTVRVLRLYDEGAPLTRA